jgi:hypothetical protein
MTSGVTPHAALHLVEDEQQIVLVGDLAQPAQIALRGRPDAALALHRLDDDRGGILADHRPHLVEIAEGDMVEARQVGAKAIEVFLVAGGGERRQRPAVERAGAGDDPMFFGMAGLILVLADHLDRQLHRLGAGIAEEDAVGEAVRDEPLGEALLAGDAE